MANLGGTYTADPDNVQEEYQALPPGDYLAHVIESDMKPTKANTGHYLELKFEILEGDNQGRQFFDRLNLDNPNEKAVEIAQRSMNALCVAAGKLSVADSDELHNIPVVAVLKVDPPRGEYGAGNSVKTYKPASEMGAAPAAGVQQNAGGSGQASSPWKRNAA